MKRSTRQRARDVITMLGVAYAAGSCAMTAWVFIASIIRQSPDVTIHLNAVGEWVWETAFVLGVAIPCCILWAALWIRDDMAKWKRPLGTGVWK